MGRIPSSLIFVDCPLLAYLTETVGMPELMPTSPQSKPDQE
jgi:hypothetical protein